MQEKEGKVQEYEKSSSQEHFEGDLSIVFALNEQ